MLFDLDGTILDSIRHIVESYHHTLRAHGLPPRSDQDWLDGIGTPLRAQLAPHATDAVPLDTLVATYRDYNIGHHDSMVRVYPGVVEALHALASRGVVLGLVTSKNRTGTARGLRLAGIESLFGAVVTVDDVERPKPDGEPVRRAVEQLGGRLDRVVYVGDSRHDMQAGRAAGVRTGAVLWGPFPRAHLEPEAPDHWLEHPGELLSLAMGA